MGGNPHDNDDESKEGCMRETRMERRMERPNRLEAREQAAQVRARQAPEGTLARSFWLWWVQTLHRSLAARARGGMAPARSVVGYASPRAEGAALIAVRCTLWIDGVEPDDRLGALEDAVRHEFEGSSIGAPV